MQGMTGTLLAAGEIAKLAACALPKERSD